MENSSNEKQANFLITCTFDDIPAEVIHQTKMHTLDNIGCIPGGFALDWTKKVAEVGRDLGGKLEAMRIAALWSVHVIMLFRQATVSTEVIS